MPNLNLGQQIYDLLVELFPINRSLSGQGVRDTLARLQEHIPLEIHEIASGTKVLDWEIPLEWNIREAWIKNSKGEIVVDFSDNNLHVVGYSIPVNETLSLETLRAHIHTIPDQPDAIPYITSYYKKNWGFCMSAQQLETLEDGDYSIYIDSDLEPGVVNYADLIIPGESEKEVIFTTYICHPSMANNELSGPCLATYLAKWLMKEKRRYTYRFVFSPETIGAITYLDQHFQTLKENVIAGYVLTCCGDDRTYSFLESRNGGTLADRAALTVLGEVYPKFQSYNFLQRGSDERQYCAPGVDLPIASVMRSKYEEYPEYHTSLDNLLLVSPQGLQGAYDVYQKIIELIEFNDYFKINVIGEPQLGKRGLYPAFSTKESFSKIRDLSNFIAYADGERDFIQIANKIGAETMSLYKVVSDLMKNDLLDIVSAPTT